MIRFMNPFMNWLKKFNRQFGFTATESKVVLFLVAAFVVGLGIKMIRSSIQPVPSFDYSASDSEFDARSARIEQPDSAVDDRSVALSDSFQITSSVHRIVNINTASKEEFVGLPGIGEAMALRIVKYREQHGPFTSVDDLSHVKGIGRKKLEKIIPVCTVGK